MSVFGVSRMMGGYGFGMMGLYWFLSVLMLLAAIVLVIWAILRMKPFGSLAQHEPYDRAVEVLRERYARGEISREEYLERLEDLQKSSD
ncbi:SHOCT domain-containing protein [Alicyclobacillus mali (ex Roth et al. 2021)]|uniref:SHOCT domain-containing protein n=1 Tax=Alicyclobacillus mali (ex Roth et al. 2021) TaxID=1123961 RepID=UPI001A8F4B48|nr:SHOCT domain-containing protein [Alicyclobacillus mali (ex Roth et al. 2021)]